MSNEDMLIHTNCPPQLVAKARQYGPNFWVPCGNYEPMPDVQAAVLAAWSDTKGLSTAELVDGELALVRHHMLEQKLPWHALRLFYQLGISAYFAMQGQVPSLLPMMGGRPPKLAQDGDVALGDGNGHKPA